MDLEGYTLEVALVVGPVDLLVLVVPAGVHHAADRAHVEEEVGLPQLQVELPIAPLLVQDLGITAVLGLLRLRPFPTGQDHRHIDQSDSQR